ncbi:hypothetical protein DUI87_31228 [Hirundo rustica rustica]|uniref:Uncharacterized protein n=1 Tax=Hirundo rustica rustica TaxID=333673 RepID=A0A3M0J024_HIRRU|nr:hypothetical protein DUI87_31228 [Hirundo rustica rustica]
MFEWSLSPSNVVLFHPLPWAGVPSANYPKAVQPDVGPFQERAATAALDSLCQGLTTLPEENFFLISESVACSEVMLHCQKEVMKLRLDLEREEALRRGLESEMSFAKKEACMQMHSVEDELHDVKIQLMELQVLNDKLQQKAAETEKMFQSARGQWEEEQQRFAVEMDNIRREHFAQKEYLIKEKKKKEKGLVSCLQGSRGGHNVRAVYHPFSQATIRDLCKAHWDYGRDSPYFRGLLRSDLEAAVVIPADLRQLFSCLLDSTEFKLWEAAWRQLLREALLSLLTDPETAIDENGNALTLEQLMGEGRWTDLTDQASGIPIIALQTIREHAVTAFFSMVPDGPVIPYYKIVQGTKEAFTKFVERLT